MKLDTLIELLGVLLLVLGAGFGVAAAALVSVPLACVVAAFFLIVAGVVVIYVAAALEAAKKPPEAPPLDGHTVA